MTLIYHVVNLNFKMTLNYGQLICMQQDYQGTTRGEDQGMVRKDYKPRLTCMSLDFPAATKSPYIEDL